MASRFVVVLAASSIITAGCPAADSGGDAAGADEDLEWRDAAPNPGLIAAEVAALRATAMVLGPSTPVGTLAGTPSVGPRGQATWALGLDVAPGVAGMTPELSIAYDSNRGNGAVGVGFALGGVPSLRRCNQTILDDGAWGPVGWTNGDALCLGGDRLILESGSYGEDGAGYRLAHDPTVRVIQHAPLSSISSFFEAFHANGHILTYGTAAATQWRGPNPAFAQPYVWGLAQRRDRFTNTIDYGYDYPTPLADGPGEMRLRSVQYGGTGAPATRRTVSLDYEGRLDALDTWWYGAHQRSTSRLAKITAAGPNGSVVRRYHFTYDAVGTAERSHLTSLRLCDAANVCMPATAFGWADPPDEVWDHSNQGWDGELTFGLGEEDLAQLLVNMRGALVTDLDGDLAHELLLRNSGSGVSSSTLWRAEDDDYAFDIGLPSPPAMPSYLDGFIAADMLAGNPPSAAHLARVQPALTAAVINADGDRLSDILVPRTPFGNAVDLDSDGYLYGQGFYLSHGQSTAPGIQPQVIDVVSYEVPDPSGERTYTMVPIDHEGDLATDAWLCRGSSAIDGRWVLMRGEGDGNGSSLEPFTFRPTDLRCSVHDELSIMPLPGGGQRLLVIPAYDDQGLPIDDDERTHYSRLSYDLDDDVASWQPAQLPRDRYQRWHDRQCRNGIAHATTGVPVYGAGMGTDRQVDVNGDGLIDVLRFELAVGDGLGQQAEIVEDLRIDTAGLDHEDWSSPQICDDDVTEPRDAVIRLWQNTGEAYFDAGVVHDFAGIAHANYWLNFVGAQTFDVTDDGLMDLVLPSTGVGGQWTLLASRGDGTFVASPTGLPEGWPAYADDESWEDDFALGARVRTFGISRDSGDSYTINDERPAIAFVGFIEDGGPDWLAVANVWRPGGSNDGEHVVSIVDGLGRTTTFDYDMVDASSHEAVDGPRVPFPVALWVASEMCVEGQTEAYQQQYGADPELFDNVCTSFDYAGAVLDRWGRGLLGFEQVWANARGVGGLETRAWTRYDVAYDESLDDYPAAGRPLEQIVVHEVDDLTAGVHEVAEIERTQWTWSHRPTLIVGGRTLLTYASKIVERAYAAPIPVSAEDAPDWTDPGVVDDLTDYREATQTETRDPYGTILSSTRETEPGDVVEMTAQGVVHDTTNWLLGQVNRVDIESCAYSGDCKTRSTEFTYSASSGLPWKTVTQPGDPELELSTTVFREGHGNVVLSIASPAMGAGRSTTTTWDAEGVSPMSVTNPLGQVSHAIHDVASGTIRAMVAAGGISMKYDYDGFYRETRRDRTATPMGGSDGAPTMTEYLAGPDAAGPQVPGVALRIRATQTAGQRVTTHINRLGQPVLEVWRGAVAIVGAIPPTIGNGVDVYRRSRYDVYGEIGEQSLPQWVGSEPVGWTHFERDGLGRPVRSVAADGTVLSTTAYTHAQQGSLATTTIATTTDANGRSEQREFDSNGQVVRSIDRVGVAACFERGAFGELITAHRNCAFGSAGPKPVTTMTYDASGRLRTEADSGWGTKTHHYNAFGELDQSTDGNGHLTSYTRDVLGRITAQTSIDGLTSFVWDSERPGYLSSETSPDGVVTSRTYDGFGRTRFEHAVVPSNSGPDDYVFEQVWGPGDRLDERVYPAVDGEPGLRVRMQYDATGRLRVVTNTAGNVLLWVWRTAEANDAVKTESTAGAVNTVRAWHPTRGWPARIDTSSGAATLQQLEYGWLADGELGWREDEQNGVQRETFVHDAARRLIQAQVYKGSPLKLKATQSLTYDAIGNIKTKSDAGGAYGYDTDGRLSTVGTASVFHDGQGNILSHGARSYTYTAFDKVRTATSGATALTLRYDAAGNRVLRTAGNLQTISIGSLYERSLNGAQSTDLAYHVMANGRAIARIERTKNAGLWTTRTYGVHDDFLGSTGVLSTNLGGVYRRLAHDAWGAARSATDWTIAATDSETAAVGLGYTGHRARLDNALIDMRGRMYDPKLARFTSADPVLADPWDPQAWNRYSYVGNRPLAFTDPSGWTRDRGPNLSYPDGGTVIRPVWVGDGVGPAPSSNSVELVSWRPSGTNFWGMGPDGLAGPQMTQRGGGWFQAGNRLYHQGGFSIGTDQVHDYTQQYYARQYPPRESGNPMQAVLDLAAGLDVAAQVGLAIASALNPVARAIDVGISLGDGIAAASRGDGMGVATAALAAVPIAGLSRGVSAARKMLPAFTRSTLDAVISSTQIGKGMTTRGASLLSKRTADGTIMGISPTQANAQKIVADVIGNPLRQQFTGRFGQLDLVGRSFGQEIAIRINLNSGQFVGFRRVDF